MLGRITVRLCISGIVLSTKLKTPSRMDVLYACFFVKRPCSEETGEAGVLQSLMSEEDLSEIQDNMEFVDINLHFK